MSCEAPGALGLATGRRRHCDGCRASKTNFGGQPGGWRNFGQMNFGKMKSIEERRTVFLQVVLALLHLGLESSTAFPDQDKPTTATGPKLLGAG